METRSTTKNIFAERLDKLRDCEAEVMSALTRHRLAVEAVTDTLWTIYDVVRSDRDPYFTPADRATRWLEQADAVEAFRDSVPFPDRTADELWEEMTR
jgi:hypothetical protein